MARCSGRPTDRAGIVGPFLVLAVLTERWMRPTSKVGVIQPAAALARGIHDATGNRSAIKMSSYGGGYSNRFRALTGHRPVATGSCGQVAACHALASGRRVRRPGELGSRSPRSASEDDIFFCPSVDLAAMGTGEFRCFDLGSGPERFFDCLAGRR